MQKYSFSVMPHSVRRVNNFYYDSKYAGKVFQVYLLPSGRASILNDLRSDDLIGRQSLVTRDASVFGGKEGGIYLMIEGSPEAIKKAEGMFPDDLKPVPNEDAQKIQQKIKEEDEKADEGMGFLFG